jgi:hypothetical protein
MAYKHDNYKPNQEGKRILQAAWEFVQGVPYKVTTRWLFYQLLQAGFYHSKEDYKGKCVPLLSRARHNLYGDWKPNTLVDDRREAIIRIGGFEDIEDAVKGMSSVGWDCKLDHFYGQDNYLEIWFEAEAMARQFQYYTKGINLVPFSGMPSISYKYSIAKSLEDKAERYQKNIIVLYFGDYDKAGLTIPETSINDIRGWCDVDFQVVRCGLNQGDEIKYNIPESIDKPGAYQWEALGNSAASELITNSIKKYLNLLLIKRSSQEGIEAAKIFDQYVAGFTEYYLNYSTMTE